MSQLPECPGRLPVGQFLISLLLQHLRQIVAEVIDQQHRVGVEPLPDLSKESHLADRTRPGSSHIDHFDVLLRPVPGQLFGEHVLVGHSDAGHERISQDHQSPMTSRFRLGHLPTSQP